MGEHLENYWSAFAVLSERERRIEVLTSAPCRNALIYVAFAVMVLNKLRRRKGWLANAISQNIVEAKPSTPIAIGTSVGALAHGCSTPPQVMPIKKLQIEPMNEAPPIQSTDRNFSMRERPGRAISSLITSCAISIVIARKGKLI